MPEETFFSFLRHFLMSWGEQLWSLKKMMIDLSSSVQFSVWALVWSRYIHHACKKFQSFFFLQLTFGFIFTRGTFFLHVFSFQMNNAWIVLSNEIFCITLRKSCQQQQKQAYCKSGSLLYCLKNKRRR